MVLDPIFSDCILLTCVEKNILWLYSLVKYIFSKGIQERWVSRDLGEWINQLALGVREQVSPCGMCLALQKEGLLACQKARKTIW